MRLSFLLAGALLLVATEARADEEPPATAPPPPRPAPTAYGEPVPPPSPPGARPAPVEYTYTPAPTPPPLGHTGFQMSIRSGASVPIGSAKDPFQNEAAAPEHWSSKMDDLVGLQIPVTLDIGGKPNKHLFIGGYLSYAVGHTAGRLAESCDRLPLDCYSTNVRLGAQVHYVFSPNDTLTPWVGYGIGYAWMTSGDGQREARLRGWDFGHFLAGLDFRLSRTFGLGAYVDYSLGTYVFQHLSAETADVGAVEGSVIGKTVHQWVTFGPRLVVMP